MIGVAFVCVSRAGVWVWDLEKEVEDTNDRCLSGFWTGGKRQRYLPLLILIPMLVV